MKKFKFRGKEYVWKWKGSPLHFVGVCMSCVAACGFLWVLVAGAIIVLP